MALRKHITYQERAEKLGVMIEFRSEGPGQRFGRFGFLLRQKRRPELGEDVQSNLRGGD